MRDLGELSLHSTRQLILRAVQSFAPPPILCPIVVHLHLAPHLGGSLTPPADPRCVCLPQRLQSVLTMSARILQLPLTSSHPLHPPNRHRRPAKPQSPIAASAAVIGPWSQIWRPVRTPSRRDPGGDSLGCLDDRGHSVRLVRSTATCIIL